MRRRAYVSNVVGGYEGGRGGRVGREEGEGVGTCRSWQKLRSSAKRQRAPVSTLCMAENARKASASSSASSRKKERDRE